MATGSGKTVIMASLILDLYKRGYNKFVFFVNRGNIVQKTIENFTNPGSSKYLFASTISISGQTPNIRAVDTLISANSNDIQILFTTIQKLHGDLFTPMEGRITLEDLSEEKIILLSDEAHHINAWTTGSRLNNAEKLEKNTWEQSIQRIFNQNQDNMLMEFTATIDVSNKEISDKYHELLIYKYDLKQFRNDKYSKDIKLYGVHDDIAERMLQAVLISQYRLMIAEKHGLLLKPVILFKSRRIADSHINYELFISIIRNLNLAKLKEVLSVNSDALKKLANYLSTHNVDMEAFISEIKMAFSPERLANVNDEKEADEIQVDINRLEDEDNQIRVVFAVDKLNEGWDVLNLFDIVRLYKERDGAYSRGGEYKPGKTTTSEAQLIGRGARYWPFIVKGSQAVDQRKYDQDLENELRILEELYYHSPRDTDYLIEIRAALVNSGMMDQKDPKTIILALKDSFLNKTIYKTGHIYLNRLQDNPHADKLTAEDYLRDLKQLEIRLPTHFTSIDNVFDEAEISREITSSKEYIVADIPGHIISKAFDRRYKFFNFSVLKSYLPQLKTKDEFSNQLLKIRLKVSGPKNAILKPTNALWLRIADDALAQLQKVIETKDAPKIGSKEFTAEPLKNIFGAEKKIIVESAEGSSGIAMSVETGDLHLDLRTRDWYVYQDDYGTSYEKRLVQLIDSMVDKLKKKWDDLYLIRNEKEFKIFSFKDGAAFMPDYVLFLKKRGQKADTFYVFMEPKMEKLAIAEKWKEDFLLDLEDYAIPVDEFNNKVQGVKILGMPFYQPGYHLEFEESLKGKILK